MSKIKSATRYNTDGTTTDVTKDYVEHLDWLRKQIDCRWIEHVSLPGGGIWLDEEGKLHGAARNELATNEYGKHLFPGDYLAGTVVAYTWA